MRRRVTDAIRGAALALVMGFAGAAVLDRALMCDQFDRACMVGGAQ